MHPFKPLIGLILFGLVVTACTPDKRSGTEDGASSFIVKQVSGYGERSEIETNSIWHIPLSIDLGFEVCLQDRSSRQDLRRQNFFVHEEKSSKGYEVQTNDYGCLKWKEKLDFNYFAGRSGWVKLKREIVGRGVVTGRRSIEVAVNPWAVGDHARDSGKLAVVFLRDGNDGFIPKPIYDGAEGIDFLAGRHPSQGEARFSVQDAKVDSQRESEQPQSIGLRYTIDTEPRIYTHRANGDDSFERVPDGEFEIEMQLMAVNAGPKMDQRVLILENQSGIKALNTARIINGRLRAEFMIVQSLRANQGNLELAIRIKPKDTGLPAVIKPFSTVLRLGAGTMVLGGGGLERLDCVGTDLCDFDKVVASSVNHGELGPSFLKENPYFRANEAYTFSNMRLGFFMVQSGETATQRTISYTASTCIIDKNTKQPLADTPLVIHYIHQKKWKDMTEIEKASFADPNAEQLSTDASLEAQKNPTNRDLQVRALKAKRYLEAESQKKKWVDQHDEIERDDIEKDTDGNGCLSWDGRVFHRYYQPEQYFVRNVEIRKASGFKEHITFYLNPWDTNIYFGRDKRELTDEKIAEIERRKPIPSRFFLGNYSYHTVRFLYNIDPFMELEVKKTVLLELAPQVLRYSGIKDARKMVEHLRDGIYLMKVGIQKSYLDPRDNSQFLLHNKTPQLQAQIESIGSEKLATKQFITTNMALVRVVDGLIIYPIELTMRDLRLMRVRSNFMVELETVDERIIQAYHKIREGQIDHNQIEQHLREFKDRLANTANLSEVFQQMEGQGKDKGKDVDLSKLSPSELEEARKKAEDERAKLQEKMEETQDLIAKKLDLLGQHFKNGGALGTNLDSEGKSLGVPYVLKKDESITDNFGLDQRQVDDLKLALEQNDFSELKLPSAEDVDLNLFVEHKSGLLPRSFVGPVIFLSNAYGDSVRATDNLDEANCSDPEHPKDWLQQSREFLRLNMIERDLGLAASKKLDNNRQNNAYQYNPYFGSLSNLCYKHVDNLIEEEKQLKAHTEDQMVAASLKYNFINSFGFDMDFVSLTDEPLLKVKQGCSEHIKDCLETTNEQVMKAQDLLTLVNENLEASTTVANTNPENIFKRFSGTAFRSERKAWSQAELPQVFFEHSIESNVAICNLLSNRISQEMLEKGLTSVSRGALREKVMEQCSSSGGLVHDIKYHVDNTGNYTFLGGLNLNFNVGESFSMSWSRSWSAGLELTDFVGMMGAKAASSYIKPASIKMGTSLSSSTGTSINESTYLVSQNAKFELDLLGYEKCGVVRISDEAFDHLRTGFGGSNVPFLGLRTANFNDPNVERAFKRGLMVCEGETRKNNPPKRVEEMYFYFTQHFTEGDMLDQADLYNHPWLLAMRGARDFSVFVNKIRSQDSVSMGSFFRGMVGLDVDRKKAWALEHLSELYANVLPSFPGYYTETGTEEDITAFLLQQSRQKNLEKNATDDLGEVFHPAIETPGVGPSTPSVIPSPASPPSP